MIPQADLERAIDRWKARKEGGAVAPDESGYAVEADAVVSEQDDVLQADSGMIAVSDDDLDRM